jgi:organic hydroperoxide reductase OsmC/OhrA
MPDLGKVLYTARTHTTGGRNGASRSSDGRLDVKLSRPGSSGDGTNPEQLLPPAGPPALSARWDMWLPSERSRSRQI